MDARYTLHFSESYSIINTAINISLKDVGFVLFIYCSTSHSRVFHLYGDVTIAHERLQNLGLYLALKTLEF
jgi:hypothetical protein